MKKPIFLMFTLFLPVFSFAQKNVVPVTQSKLLGIELPEGSKQDNRFLSVSAAEQFLVMSTEHKGTSFTAVEVFLLPASSLSGSGGMEPVDILSKNGYRVSGDKGDEKLFWATTNTAAYLIYYSEQSNPAEMYVGQAANQAQTEDQAQTAAESAVQQNRQADSPAWDYQYSISNFDDGWTASVQSDHVLVERGNARIYLYYAVPYNADNFSGTGIMDRDYYWDNYVAKQFHVLSKQYNDAGEIISSLKPKYVEGWGTDPVTGGKRFLAMTLSVSPNTAVITLASFPDEGSFRQAFPKANDRYVSDLTGMSRYNKFALGAKDFTGTWQNGNTSTLQWAYETAAGYEGYAGMTVAATSAVFVFHTDGTYTSTHNGASGAAGALNTFQQNYRGRNTVTNWSMVLSDRREGKTQVFDAHYQAVSGGRLLYLNNHSGESYMLVRTK